MPRSEATCLQGLSVAAREAAVHRSADPLTLEELRARPSQVGALVRHGRRVEPALYHRASVADEDGKLRLPGGLSPVSKRWASGFRLVPPVKDAHKFIRFADWDSDGWVSIYEVAVALAAVLPVEAEAVERFFRDRIDVGQDGLLTEAELCEQASPFLLDRLPELLEAAEAPEAPELTRGAGRAELLSWFDHWDLQGAGSLELGELQFAVARLLYRALGPDVEVETKETAACLFLTKAGVGGSGGPNLTKEDFLDVLAPALQANLPEPQLGSPGAASSRRGAAAATCPRGHVLERFNTVCSCFCDACSGMQPLGSEMLGCRPCNYDLCVACVERVLLQPPRPRALGAARTGPGGPLAWLPSWQAPPARSGFGPAERQVEPLTPDSIDEPVLDSLLWRVS